jgi:hypothetical protein
LLSLLLLMLAVLTAADVLRLGARGSYLPLEEESRGLLAVEL